MSSGSICLSGLGLCGAGLFWASVYYKPWIHCCVHISVHSRSFLEERAALLGSHLFQVGLPRSRLPLKHSRAEAGRGRAGAVLTAAPSSLPLLDLPSPPLSLVSLCPGLLFPFQFTAQGQEREGHPEALARPAGIHVAWASLCSWAPHQGSQGHPQADLRLTSARFLPQG